MAEAEPLPPGVLRFPEGIPGFETLTEFVLLQDEELLPILFLTSLGEPKICLPVMPAQRISPGYRARIGPEDRKLLGLPDEPEAGGDVLCLAVLNLGDGSGPATANLLAPIVVNPETWIAKQIIQAESAYSAVADVL